MLVVLINCSTMGSDLNFPKTFSSDLTLIFTHKFHCIVLSPTIAAKFTFTFIARCLLFWQSYKNLLDFNFSYKPE